MTDDEQIDQMMLDAEMEERMNQRFTVNYKGEPVATYDLWGDALEAARIEGFRNVTIDQTMVNGKGEIETIRLTPHEIRQDYEERGL